MNYVWINEENQILCSRNFEDIEEQLNSGIIGISGAIFDDENELFLAQKKFDIPIINMKDHPETIEQILKIE